jgi:CheY-like chemotaxis protein
MSPDGWSEGDDVARWEAVEAQAREHQARQTQEAEVPSEVAEAPWDAGSPAWWHDPEGTTPADAPAAAEPSVAPDPGDVGADILVADADYAVGASIEQAMTDRGWHVRRVDNGEQALAEFVRLPPDCFVFDYSLPGLGGLDLLRTLAESGTADRTRLVVHSTQTQALHVARARALGAHRFLDRPRRSPDRLVEAVAEQLRELARLGSAPGSTPSPSGEPPSPPRVGDSGPSTGHARPGRSDEDRSLRSAFGRGGGPPGRVPKLG